jgi:hypothetical protein
MIGTQTNKKEKTSHTLETTLSRSSTSEEGSNLDKYYNKLL